jgi:hypothetical protein
MATRRGQWGNQRERHAERTDADVGRVHVFWQEEHRTKSHDEEHEAAGGQTEPAPACPQRGHQRHGCQSERDGTGRTAPRRGVDRCIERRQRGRHVRAERFQHRPPVEGQRVTALEQGRPDGIVRREDDVHEDELRDQVEPTDDPERGDFSWSRRQSRRA